MIIIQEYFHYLTDIVLANWFGAVTVVIIFTIILIWMIGWLRRDAKRNAYVDSFPQIFLEVKVDELNEKSAIAMEQIFSAMHAIHQNFTRGEDMDGKVVLWMSCEIVSLGGKVSFIFKMPMRFRTLFESAVFAQYPKAEINEVEDYLKNIPHFYDPETSEFEFWGTQMNKKKESAYPIRTYASDQSFEHGAQETFIDPVSNIIEVMSNLQPHELMAYQIVIRPVNDDWKLHTVHLLEKLKGIPQKHGDDIWLKIVHFIPDLFATILVEMVSGPKDEHASPARVQEEPPSLMLHRSDVEKKIITAIESGLGKIGYDTRVRLLYLAPKGKLNKALRVPEIIGAFRFFDDVNLNGLKPDIGHTWTDGPTYNLSERFEKPYVEWAKLTRKRHFLHNFIPRTSWRGSDMFKMNTEELATIFHFPQIPHTRVSQLEKISTVKVAPPMNLPIG